jgi:hypothetical protein
MKGYPANYVCAICSQTFTRRGSCERHRIENNLDPTASVRFVDYLVGRLSGRYWPGSPSLHRRKIGEKKSQINDTFFVKRYKNDKYPKVFPSRFSIMPDIITRRYSQNMMKGGSRFNETHYTSAKSVPADNVEKMDGNRDGIEFCIRETTLRYQKRIHVDSDDHLLEDSQILREFTTLVQTYYSDFNAMYILTYSKILRGQAYDDWIDSRLAILREMDKNHRLSRPHTFM